ncbi:hypothetical protein [Streptomyces sp. NPDC006368]|uniref:hypothetical protein n=1 Tax=Streptomyces sp. NPDC006368 TaxID=3156760 RepID=UPI0033BB7B25
MVAATGAPAAALAPQIGAPEQPVTEIPVAPVPATATQWDYGLAESTASTESEEPKSYASTSAR